MTDVADAVNLGVSSLVTVAVAGAVIRQTNRLGQRRRRRKRFNKSI